MYVCTYAYVCLRMLVSIHVGIASTFFLWMCYREQVNLIGHWSNTRCPVLCWNPPSGTCPAPKWEFISLTFAVGAPPPPPSSRSPLQTSPPKKFKFLHVLSPPQTHPIPSRLTQVVQANAHLIHFLDGVFHGSNLYQMSLALGISLPNQRWNIPPNCQRLISNKVLKADQPPLSASTDFYSSNLKD